MKRKFKFIGVVCICIAILFGIGFVVSIPARMVSHETIKVTDKYIKGNGGDGTYMITGTKTDDKEEVFEDKDSLLSFKWNSSDLYAKMKKGSTYKIKCRGIRIPLFSNYRNIVSATKVSE